MADTRERKNPRATAITLAAAMFSGFAVAQNAAAQTADAPLAEENALVLFQNGPAEVTETRMLERDDTAERIRAGGLPGAADDATLAARLILPDGTIRVPSSLSLQAAETAGHQLMNRMIGEEIGWLTRNPATGEETLLEGTLRSASQGTYVVERDGGIEVLPPGRLRLNEIPDDVALSRTATAAVDVPAGSSRLLLRYSADGIDWSAAYDGQIADDGSSLLLTGDFILKNDTAHDFENAFVTLVAGDVPRASRPRPLASPRAEMSTMAMADAKGVPEPVSVGERQIYSLEDRVDVPANASVRRALIDAASVPIERRFVLEGQGDVWPGHRQPEEMLRPRVEISFRNDRDSGLGNPLPRGLISVRTANPKGPAELSPLLIAETRMQDTPVGEEVTLDIGEAFDVTAERTLTGYEPLGDAANRNGRGPYRATHEITLSNAKDTPVVVEVVERFSDVRHIERSNIPAETERAREARWQVTVPAGGEKTLTYRVRVGEE